jgi:hypothetical protein
MTTSLVDCYPNCREHTNTGQDFALAGVGPYPDGQDRISSGFVLTVHHRTAGDLVPAGAG